MDSLCTTQGVPRACLPPATPTLLSPNSGPFQFLVLDITDFRVKLVTTQGESGPESAEPRGKSQFCMGPVITVGCCGQEGSSPRRLSLRKYTFINSGVTQKLPAANTAEWPPQARQPLFSRVLTILW